jgi:hypothetical protein
MYTVLTRPKSGKTTLSNAYHMIKGVHDRLFPNEQLIRVQLAFALQVLEPYAIDSDEESMRRAA